MKSVVFQMYVEKDDYLPDLLTLNKTVEIEVEAKIVKTFNGLKLVDITSMSLDGRELYEDEIENVVLDIGWDIIELYALESAIEQRNAA